VLNRRRLAGIFLAVVMLSFGCSDDVVCPGVGETDTVPYIAAKVVERSTTLGDTTFVAVFCSADPLPSLFVASVNLRSITDISTADPPGLVATLEDGQLIWVTGTPCSLRVTTDYGFAGASATVPGAFSVSADASIVLGDPLTLRWTASPDADYYTVAAVLEGGRNGAIELSATTADTTATFDPSSLPFAGSITGSVSAVSGPFPEGGTEGNITDAGWGFFTVSYGGPLSEFEVSIVDPP